jgi:hypothetical protein
MVDQGRRLLAGFSEPTGEDVLGELKSRLLSLEKLGNFQ